MKRSMFLAVLLTLVLAAPAASSDAVLSGPMFGIMNGCLSLMGVGFDGDVSVDGVVGYGAGNGPRHVDKGDLDGVVDYGVGSGPRSVLDSTTDGVVGYGTGTGPRSVFTGVSGGPR